MTCGWSQWINVGMPTQGPNGGYDKSIQDIVSADHSVCSDPKEVQCRAVLYPLQSMAQVGQNVTCNKDVGLVCINNQQGPNQNCFDYEIQFKCCGCPTPSTTKTTTRTTTSTMPTTTTPTTTETTTTTATTTPTTTTPTTTETTTPTTTPTTTTPTTTDITTKCHCLHDGINFPPGSMVYNVTDNDGHCFTGHCNATCQVEVNDHPCSFKQCDHLTPKRKNGEVWKVTSCITGRCDDGNVTFHDKQCPISKPVVCANNFPAVEVMDEDGCCTHYECQCICYGWGDPHYVTFDGTYYDFQGNCSYWLMKEISPKYNFSAMIDNTYCGDGLSCPQSITVFYQSYKIFITQNDINGNFINQISVNDKPVSLAYQNKDFRLITTGIETVLVIPNIQAKVTFSGLIFGIYLPYSDFGGNTQGQCGTCDNNRTDDCRLPSGKIDASCPDMAHDWRTTGPCERVPPTPTPPPDTCDTTICEIIKSSLFEACHAKIGYGPFVEACEFDICHIPIKHIGCSSLQAYADACAEAGICIDWRGATDGICDYNCQSPKVYRACGPQVEHTCESWYNSKFIFAVNEFSKMTEMELEGCFCPNGTHLLSSTSNECVPTCEICRLPNGIWKMPNSTWIEGCQECTCEEDTFQVVCRDVSCPAQPPLSCDQEGKVMVTETVGCCQEKKCVCKVTTCPAMPTCPVGHTVEITTGTCFPNASCVIQKDVCVFQNNVYQVGDVVPMKKPCDNCICSKNPDGSSGFNIVECQPTPCDTHCPLGYEYQTVAGQCCGKCLQTSCVITPSNVSQTLQPGTIWTPVDNPCVKFECVKIATQFITVEAKTICPLYDPKECIPGTETIAPDGCCPVCIPKGNPCNMSTTAMYLESQGCKSKERVNVTSCSGACGTITFYSTKMGSLQHTCSCCQEVATSKRMVQLSCPDNTEISFSYIHIDNCGCLKTECSVPGPSTMANTDFNVKSRRRRR
ncbi:mucin-2-like [Pungitius pungitius]|uniref:mucin-2-like n=1 Tax=Pungitius pungitius TaxID=134920 RepID=UPI002E13DB40